jgi:glycosyltransferase involved in cell wall biosynthesis
MHPHFPTRMHYRLARGLEDLYVRRGDAVVYVSQTNLDAVRARAPEQLREKLQLVRYGADPPEARPSDSPPADRFEIAYVGAMSGWWTLIGDHAPAGRLKRLYAAWTRLGRFERTVLDQRTSSPAIAGQAILDVLAEHPTWSERVKLMIYGNPYDASVVSRALARAGVDQVVTVLDPVPHDEVARINAAALLFITLPKRVDGSPGGRISAKTYEYLMTDRPILAAVPRGENWSYLADKPGVWLVEPDDREAMKQIIAEMAEAKLAGAPRVFDREPLRAELSYDARAREFAAVIRAGIERRRRSS